MAHLRALRHWRYRETALVAITVAALVLVIVLAVGHVTGPPSGKGRVVIHGHCYGEHVYPLTFDPNYVRPTSVHAVAEVEYQQARDSYTFDLDPGSYYLTDDVSDGGCRDTVTVTAGQTIEIRATELPGFTV